MADGDGAAIHIHLGGVPAHVLVHGAGLGGERFIGLHQVQVGGLPARLLQRRPGGGDGAGAHHLGINACLRPGSDARQGGKATGGGVFRAHQHQGGSAVIQAAGIAGSHRAVLGESGLQARHRLIGRAVADIFVGVHNRIAPAALHGDGDDLVLELARLPCCFRLVLAGDGKTILFLAGDLPLGGDILGGHAHVIAVEDVPQSVADHRVDQLHVAELLAGAQIGGMGRKAHALLAACHHDAAVAALDGLGAQGDGTKARAADHVDAPGRGIDWKPGGDGGLAGGVLPLGGGQHLAQDHFGHLPRRDPGPFQRATDGHFAQLVGGKRGECSIEGTHRRAGGRHDHDVFHWGPPARISGLM